VDEIVISTFTEQAEDRFRSYELLASLFRLEGAQKEPATDLSRRSIT
jgi:hypothetical protein